MIVAVQELDYASFLQVILTDEVALGAGCPCSEGPPGVTGTG